MELNLIESQEIREAAKEQTAGLMKCGSSYWEIELRYGRTAGKSRSTYAVKVTSKLAKQEAGIYTYHDFMTEKYVRAEMDDFGYCSEAVFEQLKSYAEYLKMHNRYIAESDMDAFLAGNSDLVEDMKNKIRDYVLSNIESIAYKTKKEYTDEKYVGAWLDTPLQMRQYDGIVLALVNNKLRDIWGIANTAEIGHIKAKLVSENFLINKDVKDITLSPGNEKKCALFRIAPVDVQREEGEVKLECTSMECHI